MTRPACCREIVNKEGTLTSRARVAVIVGLLLAGGSIATQASWTAQLRALPEDFELKPRILFEGCNGSTGQLYDLQFAFHNPTGEDVTIDWDASSLQLPEDRAWHVVRPEAAGEGSTTVVPARSSVTVRVCPSRSQTDGGNCDQSWLHPSLFSDGASLRLRLAVLSGDDVQTSEWVWRFAYEEPEGRSGFTLDSGLPPVVLLAMAAAIFALLLFP